MFKIERQSYGFLITFADFIEKPEMERWGEESKKALSTQSGDFGVVVDMRTLKPLSPEVQEVMVNAQKLYKDKGMKRSAVILNNTVTTMQFQRLARSSGIYEWERYIDFSKNPNWQSIAEAWVAEGIDPDK